MNRNIINLEGKSGDLPRGARPVACLDFDASGFGVAVSFEDGLPSARTSNTKKKDPQLRLPRKKNKFTQPRTTVHPGMNDSPITLLIIQDYSHYGTILFTLCSRSAM